jgi:Methyltransferase domain
VSPIDALDRAKHRTANTPLSGRTGVTFESGKAMALTNQHLNNLKTYIKNIPVIGPTAKKLARLPVVARARRLAFPGSAAYWETRYRYGGTSGAGSYGRLAQFKAAVLNEFVRAKNIRTVIEFGCGDGAQVELARYPEYVGIDVAALSVKACSARFAHDSTKRFYLAAAFPTSLGKFDLSLSLDVIYHLVEDHVFDSYMNSLFARSRSYVIIYSSNYDTTTNSSHVRHRKFTTWIAENARDWRSEGHVPNSFPWDPNRPDDTSFADFYFFARQGL